MAANRPQPLLNLIPSVKGDSTNMQAGVFQNWLKSDQLRGLPPQTWGLLPNLQLLVLDASLLRTSKTFEERRALLCRTYTEDAIFEDPISSCQGRTALFLCSYFWTQLFPWVEVEGRSPKLPSSKAGTSQVCFSSKYTLSLPEVEKGPLRHLMAQLPDSFSFEVVTTLIIDTRRAAITHHSEQWVGLLGPRALPSSIRRWTGWLVTVSSRVWIVGSGIKQALQAGLWPLHAP